MVEPVPTKRIEAACTEHLECKKDCKRKSIHKSPKWFGPWLTGNPELEETCESRISNNLVNEIFKGL